eukprot:COSAG05_NODE_7043_length_863_cov_1.206806_2_plen_74_part_00
MVIGLANRVVADRILHGSDLHMRASYCIPLMSSSGADAACARGRAAARTYGGGVAAIARGGGRRFSSYLYELV